MANDVFANNREVSCKKADGKSICAFPDVCMTPPENPATPPGVPVPYPNTGLASDTTDGSKSVKISGKEIMLKNKSYFKKSMGDEAGCAAKKGVVTSVNRGKVYFNAWSMDVKCEGENVVRHFDMTTHNHASQPGATPPWPFVDSMAIKTRDPCAEEKEEEVRACGQKGQEGNQKYNQNRTPVYKSKSQCCNSKECQKARECRLEEYGGSGSPNCCPGKTGHHLVEGHCFRAAGTSLSTEGGERLEGLEGYNYKKAPTVCVTGSGKQKQHGKLHVIQQSIEAAFNEKGKEQARWRRAGNFDSAKGDFSDGISKWTYGQARDAGVTAHSTVFSHCSKKCTKAQLDNYHMREPVNMTEGTPVRTDPNPKIPQSGVSLDAAQQATAMAKIKTAFSNTIAKAVTGIQQLKW